MKTDYEQIPSEIVEWMTELSYEALNQAQQQKVLLYMDMDEYITYAATFQLIDERMDKSQNKEALLHLFDKTYPSTKTTNSYSLVWWKAACIALFLSTCLIGYKWYHQSTNTVVETLVKHDTIFQQQIVYRDQLLPNALPSNVIAPVAMVSNITNTKTSLHEAKKPFKPQIPATIKPNRANHVEKFAAVSAQSNEMQVIALSTLSDKINATKKNSKNDDSLERSFRFVSL